MDANAVAVGVKNHRHAAGRTFHRFQAKLDVVLFQMRDGVVEIFDFERGHAAVGVGREHSRRAADGQRIRAEFVFDPLAFEDGRRFQTQHAFVKFTRPLDVRDGVTTKCEFDDFEHKNLSRAEKLFFN